MRDALHLRTACVRQNVDQWGAFTDIDERTMDELFGADNPRGTLPITLVATLHGHYAGCVSLRARSMGALTHPEVYIDDLSPWLSNMWVADNARGYGLATRLTIELERMAAELGFDTIYSSTAHPNSLYHKLGYADIEQRRHRDDTIFLIKKSL